MKLSVGSFNIKSLYCNYVSINDSGIVNLILKNDLDIICIQETNFKYVETLSNKLNWNYYYYKHNAIFTKYPIFESNTVIIETNKYCHNDVIRNAIICDIIINGKKIKIINTHLNHLSEKTRLNELDILRPYLDECDILVGDFNSLNREDYTDKDLYNISMSRKKGKIEEVAFEVTKFIKNNGFNIIPFSGQTCPYKTRIDYTFYKPKLQHISNKIINMIDACVSDHNMIISTFEI